MPPLIAHDSRRPASRPVQAATDMAKQREARMAGRRRKIDVAAFAIGWGVTLTCASESARSDDISDFYAGRNVQLIIGYAPGGGYDDYARMLGRHIARHIPGNPTVVVQNMPGAGSLRAANYLYN